MVTVLHKKENRLFSGEVRHESNNKTFSRKTKSSTISDKSENKNRGCSATLRSYRRLPRPSSAKLEQLFNFSYGTSSKLRSQQNNRLKNQTDKDEAEFNSPKSSSQFTRFGFKKTYQKPSLLIKLPSQRIRNKHLLNENIGLNINLDETILDANATCLSSVQIGRSQMKSKSSKLGSRNKTSQQPLAKEGGFFQQPRKNKKYQKNAKSSANDCLSDEDFFVNDKTQTKPKSDNKCRFSGRSLIPIAKSLLELPEKDGKACSKFDLQPKFVEQQHQRLQGEFSSMSSGQNLSNENETALKSLRPMSQSSLKFVKRDETNIFDAGLRQESKSSFGSTSSSLRNLSTCSLASGNGNSTSDEENTKSVKLDQPLGSKTTIVSSCCDVDCQHSLWSSNRSYFLRVTENRRKLHRKEWEQKQSKMGFASIPPVFHRDRAVQELQNELAKANHKIRIQETEIQYLRKKIYMSRAAKVIKREKERLIGINRMRTTDDAVPICKVAIDDTCTRDDANAIRTCKCEVPECRDEKGHGDETNDGSLVVEVCGSIPAQTSKSFDQEESLPNEAGDVTKMLSKPCDQGYFSLPRRSGSFTVSSPKFPAHQLPTPTSFSIESTFYHKSLTDFTDSSVFSLAIPNGKLNVSCESVGCQTDLMLFSKTSDEFNNTLILLQSAYNRNALAESGKDEKFQISSFFFEVMPNILILTALWRNSHGHIIDLELLLRRYVLPTIRRWFN